jgi:hypothetical protein
VSALPIVGRPRRSLLASLQLGDSACDGRTRRQSRACSADLLRVLSALIYTIFEGTSEIQRLVVARAVSALHIP